MTLVLVVDDVAPLAEQYAYDLRAHGRVRGARPRPTAAQGAGAARRGAGGLRRCSTSRCRAWTASRCCARWSGRASEVPVIVYTGTGNYDRCVQAVRLGAYGFIDKAEPMERVVQEIETRDRAAPAPRRRSRRSGGSWAGRPRWSAAARPWRELRETIARVAPMPSPVLIIGRERDRQGAGGPRPPPARAAARRRRSSRSTAPRCPRAWSRASSSATSGARSPARSAPGKGAFEAAERGTLFLDEIGELPLAGAGQAAPRARGAAGHPARRDEAGRRSRPGSWRRPTGISRPRSAAGRFREDLYYRLNVHLIAVPPLRERLSDIPALAEQFLTGICARFGDAPEEASRPTRSTCSWPTSGAGTTCASCGTCVERMIIAADGEVIAPGARAPRRSGRAAVRAAPATADRASRSSRRRRSGGSSCRRWSGTSGTSPGPPRSSAWPTTRACSRSCAGTRSGGQAEWRVRIRHMRPWCLSCPAGHSADAIPLQVRALLSSCQHRLQHGDPARPGVLLATCLPSRHGCPITPRASGATAQEESHAHPPHPARDPRRRCSWFRSPWPAGNKRPVTTTISTASATGSLSRRRTESGTPSGTVTGPGQRRPVSYADAEAAYTGGSYWRGDPAVRGLSPPAPRQPVGPLHVRPVGLEGGRSPSEALTGFDEALRLDPEHRKSLLQLRPGAAGDRQPGSRRWSGSSAAWASSRCRPRGTACWAGPAYELGQVDGGDRRLPARHRASTTGMSGP